MWGKKFNLYFRKEIVIKVEGWVNKYGFIVERNCFGNKIKIRLEWCGVYVNGRKVEFFSLDLFCFCCFLLSGFNLERVCDMISIM